MASAKNYTYEEDYIPSVGNEKTKSKTKVDTGTGTNSITKFGCGCLRKLCGRKRRNDKKDISTQHIADSDDGYADDYRIDRNADPIHYDDDTDGKRAKKVNKHADPIPYEYEETDGRRTKKVNKHADPIPYDYEDTDGRRTKKVNKHADPIPYEYEETDGKRAKKVNKYADPIPYVYEDTDGKRAKKVNKHADPISYDYEETDGKRAKKVNKNADPIYYDYEKTDGKRAKKVIKHADPIYYDYEDTDGKRAKKVIKHADHIEYEHEKKDGERSKITADTRRRSCLCNAIRSIVASTDTSDACGKSGGCCFSSNAPDDLSTTRHNKRGGNDKRLATDYVDSTGQGNKERDGHRYDKRNDSRYLEDTDKRLPYQPTSYKEEYQDRHSKIDAHGSATTDKRMLKNGNLSDASGTGKANRRGETNSTAYSANGRLLSGYVEDTKKGNGKPAPSHGGYTHDHGHDDGVVDGIGIKNGKLVLSGTRKSSSFVLGPDKDNGKPAPSNGSYTHDYGHDDGVVDGIGNNNGKRVVKRSRKSSSYAENSGKDNGKRATNHVGYTHDYRDDNGFVDGIGNSNGKRVLNRGRKSSTYMQGTAKDNGKPTTNSGTSTDNIPSSFKKQMSHKDEHRHVQISLTDIEKGNTGVQTDVKRTDNMDDMEIDIREKLQRSHTYNAYVAEQPSASSRPEQSGYKKMSKSTDMHGEQNAKTTQANRPEQSGYKKMSKSNDMHGEQNAKTTQANRTEQSSYKKMSKTTDLHGEQNAKTIPANRTEQSSYKKMSKSTDMHGVQNAKTIPANRTEQSSYKKMSKSTDLHGEKNRKPAEQENSYGSSYNNSNYAIKDEYSKVAEAQTAEDVADNPSDVKKETCRGNTLTVKEIVVCALRCEVMGYVMESLSLYEECIRRLRKKIITETLSDDTKLEIKEDLRNYEAHAQRLRRQIQHRIFQSNLIEQIEITEDSRGHSFERLFSKYLNDQVTEAHIYEPTLIEDNHYKNLISFLELLVKCCPNLRYIRLTTKKHLPTEIKQKQTLKDICEQMQNISVAFNFRFDETLLDHKVILSSGIIIDMTRGLNFFKPIEVPYSLGLCDYDFQRCCKSKIEVWLTTPFAEKSYYPTNNSEACKRSPAQDECYFETMMR